MKRGLRFAVLGSVLTAATIAVLPSQEATYTPRAKSEASAAGAAAYLHSLRANQVTGEVNQEDIQSAIESLKNMPESSLGLTWAERGPDNRGGRTRGLAINPTNPAEMYTGGVSGGLYFSNTGGLSWTEVNPEQENLAVMTIAYSKNGDVYYGTGEGLYNTWTTGYGASTSSGFPGAGVFKKGANETEFTQLSATANFSSVGAIVTDPSDNDKVFMATSSGIRVSTNGGTTWSNPITGIGANGTAWDMHMDAAGRLWSTLGGRTMMSSDGGTNWTEVSKSNATSTQLPRSGGRIMFASARDDQDYIYTVHITSGNALAGVYRSTDGGTTWSKIGQKSTYFDPFCSSQCQGEYDLAVAVDAANKNRIIVGGVTVWEWEQGQGWNQVNGFGPYNIHADQHDVVWHPTDDQKVYIVNDGGIYFSKDGGETWNTLNKNYVTTQFYNIGISADRYIVGGTQDNGSFVMDGSGNTPNTGRSLGAVDNFSGDGGYSAISWLVPKIYFTEYQGGRIGRSENSGQSFSSFWDSRSADGVGSWMTPFYLYENSADALSTDSVMFKVTPAVRSLGFASAGQDSFSSTIKPIQLDAVMDASTFEVRSGTLLVTSDASGNLSGDGTGTFDATTGEFTVEFSNGTPAAEIVATVDVSYPAGSTLVLGSNTNGLPFRYTLNNALGSNDSVIVQDPVSSMFIVGFSGSVWMTRGALDFSQTPTWYKLANIVGTTQALEVSADGNYAWVGTESGRIYRITGLNGARSYATADLDSGATAVQVDLVQQISGRNVTSIAVDPNNNDRVLVTLGNYGNANYVYYSSNATAASPNFIVKDGNLGNFPVYAATFDKGDAANAIIGTEYGVFSTDNINAAAPNWGADNSGLARVPVFTLKQYRTNKSSTADMEVKEGDIFAGTFGRGTFSTGSLMTTRSIGITEQDLTEEKSAMKLFPNPAQDFTTIELETAEGNYVAEIVDLNGRTVYTQNLEATTSGVQKFKVNVSGLSNGMYIVGIQGLPATYTRLMVAH